MSAKCAKSKVNVEHREAESQPTADEEIEERFSNAQLWIENWSVIDVFITLFTH